VVELGLDDIKGSEGVGAVGVLSGDAINDIF